MIPHLESLKMVLLLHKKSSSLPKKKKKKNHKNSAFAHDKAAWGKLYKGGHIRVWGHILFLLNKILLEYNHIHLSIGCL